MSIRRLSSPHLPQQQRDDDDECAAALPGGHARALGLPPRCGGAVSGSETRTLLLPPVLSRRLWGADGRRLLLVRPGGLRAEEGCGGLQQRLPGREGGIAASEHHVPGPEGAGSGARQRRWLRLLMGEPGRVQALRRLRPQLPSSEPDRPLWTLLLGNEGVWQLDLHAMRASASAEAGGACRTAVNWLAPHLFRGGKGQLGLPRSALGGRRGPAQRDPHTTTTTTGRQEEAVAEGGASSRLVFAVLAAWGGTAPQEEAPTWGGTPRPFLLSSNKNT